MRASIVGLWEVWGSRLALRTPRPFDLHNIQDVDRLVRTCLGAMDCFQQGRHSPHEVLHADDMYHVRRLIQAHVVMVEGERAETRGVFESVECSACLGRLEAVLSDVDVTKVLAHAADAVEKKLQVPETDEMEMVRAVQDWSSFTKDLFVGTQRRGE